MLTKEEYIDIIDFLDFFYSDNLIATAELRKRKSKEFQKEDVVNFKSKLDKLQQLIEEHFYIPPIITAFKIYSDSTFQSFTKKELIEYIHTIYHNWENTCIVNERVIKMNYKLQSEIDELKSNKPLKFEELKAGMWVWDNKIKQYYQISCVFEDNREMATYGLMNGFVLFEENRFYRKQVLDE